MKKINILILITLIISIIADNRVVPNHSFPIEPNKQKVQQTVQQQKAQKQTSQEELSEEKEVVE